MEKLLPVNQHNKTRRLPMPHNMLYKKIFVRTAPFTSLWVGGWPGEPSPSTHPMLLCAHVLGYHPDSTLPVPEPTQPSVKWKLLPTTPSGTSPGGFCSGPQDQQLGQCLELVELSIKNCFAHGPVNPSSHWGCLPWYVLSASLAGFISEKARLSDCFTALKGLCFSS